MGPELIKACADQADKFTATVALKVGFMKENAKPAGGFIGPCVIRSATGVCLSLLSSDGVIDYRAPATIEPGESASFLGPHPSRFPRGTIYEVQVFEGPFTTDVGGAGGTRPPALTSRSRGFS